MRAYAKGREREKERERAREWGKESGGVYAPGAKVKYVAAAPASRSIMQRVTHASLLHCEPCYASARQGARRIYGGISAVIERYAPSSRYLFLPVGADASLRSSTLLVRPVCDVTSTSSCQSRENWLRRAPKILRSGRTSESHKSIRYLWWCERSLASKWRKHVEDLIFAKMPE